jgi:hypothetical protein
MFTTLMRALGAAVAALFGDDPHQTEFPLTDQTRGSARRSRNAIRRVEAVLAPFAISVTRSPRAQRRAKKATAGGEPQTAVPRGCE